MNTSIKQFEMRRRWLRRFWLAGVVCVQLLLLPGAFALDPARSVFQYNCRSWTRQSGLPAGRVNAIAQTEDGYLWLGTPAGLLRFDGVEFKQFDMDQFRSTVVTSLSSSKRGGLWFGLESSAFGYCDGTGVAPLGKSEWGGSNMTVNCVLEGRAGDLWIAAQTLAGRLTANLEYEPILNTPGGKDFYCATALFQDSQGRVWLGTVGKGTYYWQNGVLTRFQDTAIEGRTINCFAEDREGRIWIGTENGLFCYESNFQKREIPFAGYQTRALLADREGVVWAGTSDGVFRYLPDGTATQLRKANGLNDDSITALAEDREGNLWIGTRSGLNQLNDVKIPTFGKTEGLPAWVNLGVCASRTGGLWVSTGEGVTYFDGKISQQHFADFGLSNGYVKRVFEARNGDLYLINGMDVVVVSGGKTVARYPNTVWPTSFTEDAQSVIVAVDGNLYRVGTNYFTPYEFTGEKPLKCWMFNILAARDGSIWTASAEGISHVTNGKTTIVTGPDPLGGDKANYLCEDSDGVIWAGLESGIARIKNGRVRMITRNDGLMDNLIYAIVPDDHGSFWVDSGRGFFRVSRRDLNAVADGKTNRVECVAYAGPDAVKSFERNQQEMSGCKTLDGRIWFPTALGVVMINPTNVPADHLAPAVYVDKVRIAGKMVDKPEQIRAPPGKNDLEFYYTAPSYVSPQSIRFRYRLEGYDKEWVEAGSRRLAFYTNLKPGNYRFQVIAANADGIWNEAGDSLQIELRPFFYQTSWFLGISGLLTLAALGGIYLWRVRHLERKQSALQQSRDFLETEVRRRTAELASANASLHDEVGERQRTAADLVQRTSSLEAEIEERNRIQLELEETHKQLLETSRLAGMSEVAINVLHNVGNVLNSVNVSASVITDHARNSKVARLTHVVTLLREHKSDLGTFITSDAKGRQLPDYLSQLTDHLLADQQTTVKELNSLRSNIEHIMEIVAMQQSHAKVSGIKQIINLNELVEDSLRMDEGELRRQHVEVVREFETGPLINMDKHKVRQILVNLIRNAKKACQDSERADKRLTLRVTNGDDRIKISITDNGVGIPAEDLTRIFSHGFTTKKDGHGFSLHSGALAAREMGGSLTVHSDGPGCGATFVLELPCEPPRAPHAITGNRDLKTPRPK